MACRRIVSRTRLWRSLFIRKNRSGGFLYWVRGKSAVAETRPRRASASYSPPVVSMVTTENGILQSEGLTGVHMVMNMCSWIGSNGWLAASSSGCRRFGGPERQRRRRHSRRVPRRSKIRRMESPGSKGCAPSQAFGNIRQLHELEADRPPARDTRRPVP